MKAFLGVLFLFSILPAMATSVKVSIFNRLCSKQLLPWTVFCVEDDRMTLDRYFNMVVSKSGADVQEHLTAGSHKLEETHIGLTRDILDHVGDTSKSIVRYYKKRNDRLETTTA